MQTPEPENGGSKTDTSLWELEDHLDELWESYLELLDQYTKAQDEIKKHLNSGFLSLAKAQSSASLGRRYGQDWYDERMKASRKAQVLSASVDDAGDSLSADVQNLNISITHNELNGRSTQSAEKTSDAESKEKEPKQQQPSPPGTPEPESHLDEEEEKKPDRTEDSKPINPLRWYGVLIPPELKRAQSAFSAVLEDSSTSDEPDATSTVRSKSPIADAVNAARALRDIEVEIRKARKAVKKAEKASSAAAH